MWVVLICCLTPETGVFPREAFDWLGVLERHQPGMLGWEEVLLSLVTAVDEGGGGDLLTGETGDQTGLESGSLSTACVYPSSA